MERYHGCLRAEAGLHDTESEVEFEVYHGLFKDGLGCVQKLLLLRIGELIHIGTHVLGPADVHVDDYIVSEEAEISGEKMCVPLPGRDLEIFPDLV